MNTLIVEDHVILQGVLKRVCSTLFGPAQVMCVADGASAIRQLQLQPFMLLVLDLPLPDVDGFAVADAAQEIAPDIRIIVVTSHCDQFTVYRAEKRRVRGFVDNRAVRISDLSEAIAKVAADGVYFSPSFLRLRSARVRDSTSFDKILSDRELSVLALIAVPFSDREIGAELGISPETVEKHRFNILRKLELKTTAELVRFARTHGIALDAEQIREGPRSREFAWRGDSTSPGLPPRTKGRRKAGFRLGSPLVSSHSHYA